MMVELRSTYLSEMQDAQQQSDGMPIEAQADVLSFYNLSNLYLANNVYQQRFFKAVKEWNNLITKHYLLDYTFIECFNNTIDR